MTAKNRKRHEVKAVATFTIHNLQTTLKVFITQCSKKDLSANVSDKDIQRKVSPELRNLAYAFRKTLAENLPSYRSYDLKIELKNEFDSLFNSLYKLSRNELEIL